jgi:Tat protein translocase TatB subunit
MTIMFLFILDSLGTSELLVILAAALIFFGPRRLPQLSRQLGKSLAEFRRASEDFKRTWEREVNLDNFDKGVEPSADNSILDKAADRIRAAREAFVSEPGAVATGSKNPIELGDPVATAPGSDTRPSAIAPSVTPVDPSLVQSREAKPQATEPAAAGPATSKHEWL